VRVILPAVFFYFPEQVTKVRVHFCNPGRELYTGHLAVASQSNQNG
jgi:hypothetical protein